MVKFIDFTPGDHGADRVHSSGGILQEFREILRPQTLVHFVDVFVTDQVFADLGDHFRDIFIVDQGQDAEFEFNS